MKKLIKFFLIIVLSVLLVVCIIFALSSLKKENTKISKPLPFSEGLASVVTKYKKTITGHEIESYYIDRNENRIIDTSEYYVSHQFKNDRALVETDYGEYAYIDKQGNVVIGNLEN